MANSADPDKPTDLDLHCLRRQGISGFSRTRFKIPLSLQNKIAFSHSTVTTLLANSADAKLMILLLYLTFTNNAYLLLHETIAWNVVSYFLEKIKIYYQFGGVWSVSSLLPRLVCSNTLDYYGNIFFSQQVEYCVVLVVLQVVYRRNQT